MTNDPIEDPDGSKLLSLYLYYAEETEKVIERRAANSRYFLTINTAFVAILGIAIEHNPEGNGYWLIALPLAGIVVCILWWWLVSSYAALTKARFTVINEMEARLPAAPYTREWQLIKNDPEHKGYSSISKLEAVVPWIFVVIYVVLVVAPLLVGGAAAP